MLLIVISLAVTMSFYCSGSKILVVIPTPSYSHPVAFRPIWKELSVRGHQITLLTTDPINNTSLSNLTEVDLGSVYKIWKPKMKSIIDETYGNYKTFLEQLVALKELIVMAELNHVEVQKILKDQNETYDLVIAEALYPVMFAFAELFKCPLVLICSLEAPANVYWTIGNPPHPIMTPDFLLGYTLPLTFAERIKSTFYVIYLKLLVQFTYDPQHEDTIRRHFGETFPSLSDIKKRIALLFVNSNPILSHRPQIPSVIQIGGGIHLTLQELPKHLKIKLDESNFGVIYFSLGTNVNTKNIDSKTVGIIMEAFSELAPLQVIWKFDDDNLPGKPQNVYISKWLPQQAVLSHPNVKAFITQGGLQSIEEATYSFVPMVGIPVFGDQLTNVRKLVEQGTGLLIDIRTITKDGLKEAVQEVIQNPKYRKRMQELVKLEKDQPMTGLERAVWWVEYVLRHNGAKHLQSPYRDLTLYEFLLLDVFAFFLIILLILICILYYTARFAIKTVIYLSHERPKVKVQ